jgi:ABC-2 type transport system ATP-binding protein
MIEVKQLVKKYGEVTILKSISFTASQGVNGFLGPNGAGKTTTMRILTGYTPPTSGTAVVAGFDVFDKSYEVRRHVGYLPENVPLYRDLTALEYLKYLAEIRGLPRRQEAALEALQRVGLVNRAHSRIRTLSKGMRQRVGLAAAILHNPSVLILDEPTIGLDPLQVLELRKLIVELGRERTVLFSTHILSEAEQVCDRLIIINQGEIVSEGTPSELRRQLERGGRILVRSHAGSAALSAVIEALPGVAFTQPYDDGVIVTPAADAPDLRPTIAAQLAAADLPLMELRPLAVHLEDIFIELVRAQHSTAVQVEAIKEEVSA